ncbi:MAG: glycosyltransferase family 1 protein [Clostridiales bacterium]|nr:glycosyltransferase family 1 protein [Clostridiales bacterium]
MKRILQVVGGMNRAGAETFLMNAYRKMDRTQWQFDFLVYTDKKQDYEDEIISLGGRVIHMPCSSGLKMMKSVREIKRIIRAYGPYTAVHAHTLHNSAYAMLACKRFSSIKRISHSHSTKNTVHSNFIKRIYEKWSLRVIRKYSQHYLACGEEAGQYLFGEQFSKKGIVVNNGVDVEKYLKAEPISLEERARWGIEDNDLIIANVARFAPVKNHEFMIALAKYLKDSGVAFKMLLVGQGELWEKIANRIKEENLQANVFLLGLREDISQILKTVDVFLMPSLFEGNPVTLVEAQASGLPCVISNNITEKIDMGLGLISRCNLESELSTWVKALLEAKERCVDEFTIWQAFCEKKYDVGSIVAQLTELYEGKTV